MSDTYHYDEGAIHNDHKRVIHINTIGGADLGKLLGAFLNDNTEDAEIVEDAVTSEGKELPERRQAILDQLLDWVERGDWVKEVTAEEVKTMLRTVLGIGEMPLSEREAEMSATLWEMLERGRGNDRVKITWQNMVGYFADRKLFNKNGSPSLNEDFFGTKNDYSNIDKGRPSNDSNGDNMPPRFRKVLPLLDKYVPKLKNAAK